MFPYSDDIPRTRFPLVTFLLIVVNVLVFFKFSLRWDYESIVWEYGFIPNDFQFVNFFTSIFLHGGIFHLIFNMWYLWLFGDNLENRLGSGTFLVFYLLGGAVAFLMHDYTTHGMTRNLPCIGASGAISAVMGGYISFFPYARVKVLIWFFLNVFTVRISAQIFFIVWFLEQLFSSDIVFRSQGQGDIAYGAHLGGFFFGLFTSFFLKYYFLPNKDRNRQDYL